jgi:lipid-binding SYLF domain-containing protein
MLPPAYPPIILPVDDGEREDTYAMKVAIVIPVTLLLISSSPVSQAGLFGPSGKTVEEKRQVVRKHRDEMLTEVFKTMPKTREKLEKAVGYATFSSSDMNLFLLASGSGYGMVVDNKTGKETFMRVASLGGGVGLGVKDIRVIFIFNDPEVMKDFIEEGWQFGGKADASAKYDETGASAEQHVKANVDFEDGTVAGGASTDVRAGTKPEDVDRAGATTSGVMEIYQFTDKGISFQATVQGTKYWKDKELNEKSDP